MFGEVDTRKGQPGKNIRVIEVIDRRIKVIDKKICMVKIRYE